MNMTSPPTDQGARRDLDSPPALSYLFHALSLYICGTGQIRCRMTRALLWAALHHRWMATGLCVAWSAVLVLVGWRFGLADSVFNGFYFVITALLVALVLPGGQGMSLGLVRRLPPLADRTTRPWMVAAVVTATLSAIAIHYRASNFAETMFATPSPWYLMYHAEKLALTLGAALVFFGLGRAVFRLSEGDGGVRWAEVHPLIQFGLGLAVATIIFAVLAMLGLLHPAAVAGISVPAAYVGCVALVRERLIQRVLAHQSACLHQRGLIYKILLVSAVAVAGFCFLTRIIYPGLLSYDEVGHYLPYDDIVGRTGSSAPNEYWYHFFISKGAGIFFAAKALSGDIFFVVSVSALFFAFNVLALVALVRRLTASEEWALFAGVFYCLLSLSQYELFARLHLLNSAVVVSLLITYYALLANRDRISVRVVATTTLLPLCYVFTMPTGSSFLLPTLGVAFLVALITRRRALSWTLATWGFAAGAAVAAHLALNYSWIGVAEGTPFRLFFFQLADHNRLKDFLSPYILVFIGEASAPQMGGFSLAGLLQISAAEIRALFQSDRYAPLAFGTSLVTPVLLGFWAYRWKRGDHLVRRQARLLAPAFIFIGFIILGAVATKQYQSSLRYLLACAPLVIAVLVTVWRAPWRWLRAYHPVGVLEQMVICLLLASMVTDTVHRYGVTPSRWAMPFHFLSGQSALQETFAYNFGEFPASCEASHRMFHRTEKTLLMSLSARYGPCHIMPGANIILEANTRVGVNWHEMALAPTPDRSRQALLESGVKHFVLDLEAPNFGCILYSPLFSRENLKRYFRIDFVQNSEYLLTFLEPGETTNVSDTFVEKFEKKRSTEYPWQMGGMCQRMAYYYALHGETYPVEQDTSLPHLRSWQ